MKIRFTIVILSSVAVLVSCHGQVDSQLSSKRDTVTGTEQRVGGPFENAEYMYIGMPKNLKATDTSPGWSQAGEKLLIKGKILKNDRKTPAPGVVMYYYHTDISGYYSSNDKLDTRVVRHGYIRGWVKSDSLGNYAIYTVRPVAYPNRTDPAHIHPSIKEPGTINEYYIDAFVFEGDPLLTPQAQKEMENRGGSGILQLIKKGDLFVGKRDIILGLNVPGYPKN